MKNKKVIFETIFITIFIGLIITALIFATGALFSAKFVLNIEVLIQKKYALYDFDIVKFSTIVAALSAVILIIFLVINDNKTKIKKKKIVRR